MDTEYSNRIQDETASGVRPLSTVLKALQALDALARFSKPTKLTEVAAAIGESKSTTFQRLLTLVRAGWVEQLEDGAYRLTLKAVGIGGAALEQAQLGDRTATFLKQLAATAGETASLAVIQDGHPYIIQRAEVGGLLRAHQPVGSSFPLHRSASGRVLYAYADPARAAEIRSLAGEVPDEEMCRRTREDGFALSTEESDVRAVAAPVFDHRGVCVSALSLVGPATRFDAEKMKAPLLASAEQITTLLQGRAPDLKNRS